MAGQTRALSFQDGGGAEVGSDGGESGGSLDVDEVVNGLVSYVFDEAFGENDREERDAFVDAFRERGRYRLSEDLIRLARDCDQAKPANVDYLALHEVYSALRALAESGFPVAVAVRCLSTQLLARQAVDF